MLLGRDLGFIISSGSKATAFRRSSGTVGNKAASCTEGRGGETEEGAGRGRADGLLAAHPD